MNMKFPAGRAALFLFVMAFAGVSQAQTVYSEDFTGATTTNQWYFTNGACLTAGTSTSTTAPNYVPSCGTIWGTYYSQQQTGQSAADAKLVGGASGTTNGGVTTAPLDVVGQGALRFTNGYPYGTDEDGSIVSKDAFDASQGVQITFKTVTYRGDSGGAPGYQDGADGIGFFLIDGTLTPNTTKPYDGTGTNLIGAVGGSLAYGCSNSNPPYDGLVGAYLGLGIDEYGNFLHGATLASGYAGTNRVNPQSGAAPVMTYNAPAGDNGYAGYGYMPNRIGLRGAGSVAWGYLNRTYPTYYPSSVLNTPARRQAAVQNTCITGQVLNYSANSYDSCPVGNGGPGTSSNTGSCPSTVSATTLTGLGLPALKDYAPIPGAYKEFGTSLKLANESAMARPNGSTVGNVFLYNLKISQDGLLSLSYSINGGAYTQVIKNQSISASNGALPSKLRFGFTGATGGSTNIHEVLCFKAAPADTSSSSSTTDQLQAGKLQTTSQAYFAYYNPNNWTGRMTAYGLAVTTTGVLTINSLANWDSQCELTGIAGLYPATTTCPTTGATTPSAAQASRVMLTWSGSAGVPFTWSGGISSSEQNVLNLGDSNGSTRLSYLRGDRSNEITTSGSGLFRTRDGVLGDIVDSSPLYVGLPRSPYFQAWNDRYVTEPTPLPENNGTSYSTFVTNRLGRLNVVYVGGNDGFLHGFRSGSEDINGNVIDNTTTPNDGAEVLAYMPSVVLNTIHSSTDPTVDYSNRNYGHNFYVDATPGSGDLFYNNTWHTWLVGGLGAGGAGLYALDITDPSPTTFAEGNAANLVIGDWSSSTITCASAPVSCGTHLGNTYGTPIIRRLHNGLWGVIFGNGFGSSAGDAGIYVMTVDNSGSKKFYYLSTGVGSSGSPNGIAYVTATDLDGDHVTDYVYAGDLQGNLWRFDLTDCAPVAGTCTFGTGTASNGWSVTPGPLFKTQSGQPITTPVVVAASKVAGNAPAVIVAFGTGQRTQLTNATPTTYASGTQSLYAVWDWNLASWNAKSPTKFAGLTAAMVKTATGLSASPYTLSSSNLQAQTFSAGSATGTVDTSNTAIGWAQCTDDTHCTGSELGWYANLPGSNGSGSYEQIVSNPTLYQQGLIVNSVVPATNSPLSCANVADNGITYILGVDSGGTFTNPGSSTKVNAFVNFQSDVNMVGLTTNETGALSVVNTQPGTTYIIGQAITPVPGQSPGQATPINLPPNVTVQRTTWTELR